MSKTDKKEQMDRRSFLRSAGAGAGVAAAVAVTTVVAGNAEAAPENAETRKKQRYKETEHVKRYYETNRL